MPQIEGNVKVNLNANQAIRELEKLDKRASELRQEIIRVNKQDIIDKKKLTSLNRELKTVEKTQKKLRQSAVNYKTVLKNLSGASLKDLNKAYRQLSYEVSKLDRNTVEWKLKASQLGKIKSEITEVRNKMRGMNTTTNKAKGGIGKLANSFNKFGAMALTAVTGVTATIAGLVSVFRTLIKITTEFEDTFTDVLTLLSAEQIQQFGDQLEQGAIDTMAKFGLEIKDVNKALFDTVSAGVNAADAIDVLDAAGTLATAGATDLATATDGLTTIVNAYHLSTAEATDAANALFSAQKYGKTTVSELSANFGQIAPIMNAAGLSYQETAAALAELTKNGLSTADATTSLKGLMSSLIKPTDEARKILEAYNVPVGASQIKTAGLTNTLEALNNMIADNPDIVASAIPNIRGLTGAMSLSGDSFEDFKNIFDNVMNDVGQGSSMMQAFGIKTGTAAFQMKQANAEFKKTVLTLKDDLNPLLINVTKNLTGYSKATSKFYIENRTDIDNLLKTSGKVAKQMMKYQYQWVTTLWNAYKGISQGIRWITKEWNKFKDAIKNLEIKSLLFLYKTTIKIQKAFIKLNKFGKELFSNIGKYVDKITSKYSNFLNKNNLLSKSITAGIETIKTKFPALISVFDKIENRIDSLFKKTTDYFKSLIDGIYKTNAGIDATLKKTDPTALNMFNKNPFAQYQLTQNNSAKIDVQQYQNTTSSNNQTTNNTTDLGFTPTDTSDYDAIKDNEADLMEYIRNIRKDLLVDEQQRKIEELNIWKEQEQKKINDWIASEEKKNEALLLLNQQYNNKLSDINNNYLQVRYDKIRELNDFITSKNQELLYNRKQLLQVEEDAIRDSYDKRIAAALEMARQNADTEAMFIDQANKLRELREEEVKQFKIKKEEEYQQQLFQIRQQYGLVTDEELKQRELDRLDELHRQGLISDEDYLAAKAQLTNDANNKEFDAAKELAEKKKALIVESLNKQMGITESVGNFFAEQKEQELKDAGDNEAKKKEIMKEYADIELAITISKIFASTGLAVMQALAQLGPVAGGIAGTFITATGLAQVEAAVNQRAKIKGYDKGGIPVVRSQDNKNFNAVPTSDRGLINKPAILVAESGPEYIVPNEGLQNPDILSFLSLLEASRQAGTLRQFRMPKLTGFESGGVTAGDVNTASQSNDIDKIIANKLDTLIMLFSNFKEEINDWQENLTVDYFSFKEADNEITKIETKATVK